MTAIYATYAAILADGEGAHGAVHIIATEDTPDENDMVQGRALCQDGPRPRSWWATNERVTCVACLACERGSVAE